jgi:hypothetical protein
MAFLRRGPGLPDHVARVVRGKVLAAAEAEDGTWLVATRDVWSPVAPDGATDVIPWERVHRADWDQDSATLRVERVEDFGAPVSPQSWTVPEPGPLVDVLRERVTASVVMQRRVDLEKRRGFSIIARRPPSRPGEVTWAYELDAGVDPDDPAVAAAAEAALREAQESLGL